MLPSDFSLEIKDIMTIARPSEYQGEWEPNGLCVNTRLWKWLSKNSTCEMIQKETLGETPLVTLRVTDSGIYGDGVTLVADSSFAPKSLQKKAVLFLVDMSVHDAEMLAHALLTVVKLQKIQRSAEVAYEDPAELDMESEACDGQAEQCLVDPLKVGKVTR